MMEAKIELTESQHAQADTIIELLCAEKADAVVFGLAYAIAFMRELGICVETDRIRLKSIWGSQECKLSIFFLSKNTIQLVVDAVGVCSRAYRECLIPVRIIKILNGTLKGHDYQLICDEKN